MHAHQQQLPPAELVLPEYACEVCGEPAEVLIWKLNLNLCRKCDGERRKDGVWRKP